MLEARCDSGGGCAYGGGDEVKAEYFYDRQVEQGTCVRTAAQRLPPPKPRTGERQLIARTPIGTLDTAAILAASKAALRPACTEGGPAASLALSPLCSWFRGGAVAATEAPPAAAIASVPRIVVRVDPVRVYILRLRDTNSSEIITRRLQNKKRPATTARPTPSAPVSDSGDAECASRVLALSSPGGTVAEVKLLQLLTSSDEHGRIVGIMEGMGGTDIDNVTDTVSDAARLMDVDGTAVTDGNGSRVVDAETERATLRERICADVRGLVADMRKQQRRLVRIMALSMCSVILFLLRVSFCSGINLLSLFFSTKRAHTLCMHSCHGPRI